MLFDVVTGLDKEEWDVEVICLSKLLTGTAPTLEQRATYDALKEAGISVRVIPKTTKDGILMFHQLVQYLRQAQPDIVHTHLFASDVWGTLAARRAGVRVVVSTEHNINKNEGRTKHVLKCYVRAKQNIVVAVSEAVQQDLLKNCLAVRKRKNCIVIPNTVDLKQFAYQPHVGLHDPVELLVVGRLVKQKGHENLLKALVQLQHPFRLRIVGEGVLRKELEKKVKALNLQDHVVFDGASTDVVAAYAAADIVLIPSRWEGFGIVALEAMASGVPVIAADVDGLRECIQDGITGMLVNMKKPNAVAEAIDALIADPDRRHSLAQQARTHVEQEYSRESMIQRYTELYYSLH